MATGRLVLLKYSSSLGPMNSGLYVVKIAIASALLSALIKWGGPMLALPESIALVIVLLPTTILGIWLVSHLSQQS